MLSRGTFSRSLALRIPAAPRMCATAGGQANLMWRSTGRRFHVTIDCLWHMPVERMCRPNVRFREATNTA